MRTSRYPPLTPERQRLAASRFFLAVRMGRQWGRSYPSLREELESAACLGLIHAAQAHDPAGGASFNRFAYLCIKQAMCVALRTAPKLTVFSEAKGAVAYGRVLLSEPDRPVGADLEESEEVERLLEALPRRDATLLRLVDLEGQTMTPAAQRFGRTKSWVSFRRKQALAELRAVAEGRC